MQPVLCQTAPFAASDYPRRAVLDGSMSGSALSEIDIFTELAASSDGVDWQPLNALAAPSRTYIGANRWGALSQVGNVDLLANEVVRFGIRVGRALPGTADLSDSRCQIRVLIFSRDGTSSPY